MMMLIVIPRQGGSARHYHSPSHYPHLQAIVTTLIHTFILFSPSSPVSSLFYYKVVCLLGRENRAHKVALLLLPEPFYYLLYLLKSSSSLATLFLICGFYFYFSCLELLELLTTSAPIEPSIAAFFPFPSFSLIPAI